MIGPNDRAHRRSRTGNLTNRANRGTKGPIDYAIGTAPSWKIFSISTARGRKVYDVALMLPAATKPLVLIVDDNRDTRDMYAVYLPLVGYSVETATDGREAVIKALALYPDVIVMDLQMPGLDGWRAMREIRGNARTAATPIIVLTGHDFKDYLRHSALAEGAWSYLVKPCLPERLAHEIEVRLSVSPIQTARAV